jgi:hypothetical protein
VTCWCGFDNAIEVLIASGKTIDEAVAAAPTKDFDSKWGGGYVTPDVFARLVFSSLTLASGGGASSQCTSFAMQTENQKGSLST